MRSTPPDRAGRAIRVDGWILDATGRRAGHFTRLLVSGNDGLRARHEQIELEERFRGHGFGRALHARSEEIYRAMGVRYVTMHAEFVGSLLWPRLGFDFDLRRAAGETEQERRADAVRKLLSPRARRVKDRPRPGELLEQWAADRDPARRAAVAAFRAAPPLHPLELAAFDAGRTDLGRELMLSASFDAIKVLQDGD